MSIAEFISAHQEEIICEFAAFAKTLMPAGVEMTEAELRDHSKDLLTAVVEDMRLVQTSDEQYRKSHGRGSARTMEASGRLHATDRIMHGYAFGAVLAEFRALRASVLRLYEESGATDLSEVRRFNESIDEGLTESMHQFASQTDSLRKERDANAEKNTSLIAEIRDRRAAEKRITALLGRLVSAQDEERRRISRDIHDQVGQPMTALKIRLEILHISPDLDLSRRADVGSALKLLEEVDQSLTSLTLELRPTGALENFGLVIALENLVSGWSKRFGIAGEFQGAGTETLRLPLDSATNLYALVQEALHNIVKHAGACNVAVLLQAQNDHVLLIIEDDGRGFDATQVSDADENRGLGLISMRERASLCGGTIEIDTAPGCGTSIFVRLPLTA
jgi:signal transduction histidine kinase